MFDLEVNEYFQSGVEPKASDRPNSHWSPIPSAGSGAKGWNFFPLAPGLFGTYLAYGLYPLLDGYWLLILIVFLFFLLVGLRPQASVFSGLALAVLAAALLLNGVLDRAPASQLNTTVIHKAIFTGIQRYGTHYEVYVSSWRAGRSQEKLEVDSGLYKRVVVGETVTVEFHKGFLGLPWLGKISPE